MRFKILVSKKAALITAAAVAGIVVASTIGFIVVCGVKATKEIKERIDHDEIDESILNENTETKEERMNRVINACPATCDFIINSINKAKKVCEYVAAFVIESSFCIHVCDFVFKYTGLKGIPLFIVVMIIMEITNLLIVFNIHKNINDCEFCNK